jgi:cytochrome c biogenesis protein CcmG/thiol:disulfide interchange protein DsbE
MQSWMTRRAVEAATAFTFVACLAAAAAPARAADAELRPWPAAKTTPPLRLADAEGRPWDLAAQRGKVVVVNFWAAWCAPCVEELPVLGALARDPATHGRVAVVGVNYKEPADTIARFTASHPLPYPVLRDRDGAAFTAWTAGVMPTTVLVDRNGRARWRSAGQIEPDDTRLRAAIAALLAE